MLWMIINTTVDTPVYRLEEAVFSSGRVVIDDGGVVHTHTHTHRRRWMRTMVAGSWLATGTTGTRVLLLSKPASYRLFLSTK